MQGDLFGPGARHTASVPCRAVVNPGTPSLLSDRKRGPDAGGVIHSQQHGKHPYRLHPSQRARDVSDLGPGQFRNPAPTGKAAVTRTSSGTGQWPNPNANTRFTRPRRPWDQRCRQSPVPRAGKDVKENWRNAFAWVSVAKTFSRQIIVSDSRGVANPCFPMPQKTSSVPSHARISGFRTGITLLDERSRQNSRRGGLKSRSFQPYH